MINFFNEKKNYRYELSNYESIKITNDCLEDRKYIFIQQRYHEYIFYYVIEGWKQTNKEDD